MKRICAAAIVLTAFAVLAVSCKKKKTEPATIQPVMYIPSSDGSYASNMMAVNTPTTDLGSPLPNVWGIFLLTRLESGISDTAGVGQFHYEDWQEVFFCGADGTGYTHPKALSLNNTDVSPSGNIYFLNGQWRGGELNHWEATRNGDVPEVSANMMDAYPSFSGAAPSESASLSSSYSYTFNPAKITNADSGYVLIHANGRVARSNTVSVRSGANNTATISAAQFANMHNEYFTLDNKVFFGAVRELVLYTDTIKTFENKQFAFVSQREVVGKIVFKQ